MFNMFDALALGEIFGFADMIGNHDQRVVKNDETEKFVLDTALVTDRAWTYETAVAHKDFNDGAWIILEGTDTKEEAIAVHERWLERLSSGVTYLMDIFDGTVYTK